MVFQNIYCNLENSNMELYVIVYFIEQIEIKLFYFNEFKQIKFFQFFVFVIVEIFVKFQIFYVYFELMVIGIDFNKGFYRQVYIGDSYIVLNFSICFVQEISGQIFVNGWFFDNVIKMIIQKINKIKEVYLYVQLEYFNLFDM